MYRNELYKIFTRKSIYVVFFFIVMMLVYASVLPTDYVMKEEVYHELFEELGGPVTEEKEEYVREQMQASDAGITSSKTSEDEAEGEVHFLVAIASGNLENLKARKNSLNEQMLSASKSSYDYRVAAKELTMLEKLGNPHGFYVIESWIGMVDFIEPFVNVILLASLILLGLNPVFADEYTKKTTGLILATKHGKRKIVSAKLMAAGTYIVIMFLSLHVVNFVLQVMIFGGVKGWNAPMQSLHVLTYPASYDQSPYAWEIWQFYAVLLTVQFLGSLALGVLVLFLSLLTKNSMIAFFISVVILGIPFLLGQIGGDNKVLEYLTSFSYLEMFQVEKLFNQFKVYNVLGYPVLYPQLLLAIFTAISVILVWFMYHHFRSQQVSE